MNEYSILFALRNIQTRLAVTCKLLITQQDVVSSRCKWTTQICLWKANNSMKLNKISKFEVHIFYLFIG